MPPLYEIRADYDRDTMVVYQAYGRPIAEAALVAGRFVPPFSLNRMTWIKPSFLWLMERSGWGRKAGQEYIFAVRISRAGWDAALAQAVLSHPKAGVYSDSEDWRSEMKHAQVVVQWDPERTLRGGKLPHRSIQVGISRHLIAAYAQEWTREIRDETHRAHRMRKLLEEGRTDQAKALLPPERPYPVDTATARRLGMEQ